MTSFSVEASNIHTGEYETYGPFDGIPLLTYEFVRASDARDDHIFVWVDPPDIGDRDQNPHDYASWTDLEGERRFDGWRRIQSVESDNARQAALGVTHSEPVGPFWTDLAFVVHDQ
jgi:hypothetical protein